MGLDVYMRWPDQTEAERQAQFTGFDVTAGSVGYLRESYGGPSPGGVWELVKDAIEADPPEAVVSVARLRELLPEAERLTAARYEGMDWKDEAVQSLRDFVALAERKEAELGHPVTIRASY